MENPLCKICFSDTSLKFELRILQKYDIKYFQCLKCGFLQTETPYWLEEAYKNPINVSDTGIVVRNLRSARIVSSLIVLFFNKNEKFVDYAGGFGLFTRIMRDFGFDFYWSDPYTKNEMARGFEIQIGKKYSLLTTFESFEHFEEPFDEVRKMLKISDTIIASTELLPKKLSIHWWYLGTEHGQHISIYTAKALQELSKRLGLFYYNLDNIHILSKKKMSIWGRFLFQSYFAKYFLYAFSYIINPFLKTKTFDDMNRYKHLS